MVIVAIEPTGHSRITGYSPESTARPGISPLPQAEPRLTNAQVIGVMHRHVGAAVARWSVRTPSRDAGKIRTDVQQHSGPLPEKV